ncbi:MAG: hypothetical protein N0A24_05830 [Armatimonadetes bacterium]|nr:hypothetical protein [Armatimonadota bacterium]MDW8153725.1 hypothetical protein [Armatimonadota bacterium]
MARDLLDRLARSARESVTVVARESERWARLARTQLELGTLRAQLGDQLKAIGRQILLRHRAGTLMDPELVLLCGQVEELEGRIRQLERELEALRAPRRPAGTEAREA